MILKTLFSHIGDLTIFMFRFFKEVFTPHFEFKEFLKQCYVIGYKSLPLIAITGFIMGLVLTLQSRPTLATFGAESWLPGMVALSLVKEIAPVITSLLCAGKIASGMGAELGSMRVTEQIDAMEVSAVNPYKYLVVTRILATTCMIPLLVFFADAIGMYGGYVGVNINGHVSMHLYFNKIAELLEFSDIIPATVKTVFFGFFIGLIGCYKGYTAKNGTQGVGIAANEAVVTASLSVFIIDMITVQITDILIK